MDYAPTSWHAVDVASTDGSGELLVQAFGAERLIYAPSGTGFGAAVNLGLASSETSDWIWLLHDDISIEPGTLAALLDQALAAGAEDVAIVGPKLREWPSLQRLIEVGISYSGTGGRETGLEPGEPDHGQHDRPRDVLAVNTAGILIRRDVWDELEGFDPLLPMFGDDIDFGWRASRAGYRVRIAPDAVAFHAEGTARRLRTHSGGDVAYFDKRRAALFTLLAHASTRVFWWQYVRLFFGSTLRFFGFLVAQSPEDAGDELHAVRAVYLHPARLKAARQRRKLASKDDTAETVRKLRPGPFLPYQHGLDSARGALTSAIRPEQAEITGRRSIGFDATGDEDDEPIQVPSLWQRRPWFVTFLLLTAFALLAGRDLWGNGPLHGGALPAAPQSAGGWWELYFEPWHAVGIGSDVAAPAFVWVLGIVAIPVWFSPDLLISALMIFAVPAAALGAHRLGRRLTDRRRLRMLWALTYALLVVASGAIGQGRIGTVVALVVLPVLVNSLLALRAKPHWQQGLRLGLWLTTITAFAPIVYLPALVGFFAVGVRRSRATWVSLALAAALPWVLVTEWMIQRVVAPSRWWWEAGLPDGSIVPTGWQLVMGRAGGASVAPAWLSIGMVVLGCAALLRAKDRPAVWWCWAVALAGLAAATLGRYATVHTGASEFDFDAWVGLPLTLWLAGLATATLVAADATKFDSRTARLALVVALIAPLGIAGWWLVRSDDGLLRRGPVDDVPAYLTSQGDNGVRTLVLEGTFAKGVGTSVVAGNGLHLGEEAVLPPLDTTTDFNALVARILSNPSSADTEALAGYGVAAIYAPADVDPALEERMDAAPGLSPSGSPDPQARVWLVDGEPVLDDAGGNSLRWLIAALHTLLGVVAFALTAPIRKRVRR